MAAQYYSNKPPYYNEVYESYFEPLRNQKLKMLELGIHRGGSLDAWEAYFGSARIVGLDIKDVYTAAPDGKVVYSEGEPVPRTFGPRVRTVKGSQADHQFLATLSDQEAPDGWDIVIDDCSHVGSLTLESFRALFPRVKKGGLYVVEDWATGYWPDFAEGQRFNRSKHLVHDGGTFCVHGAGITGFVKQLVDEVALDDAKRVGDSNRGSQIDWVHYYKGVVVMKKRGKLGDSLEV
ncbi:MAG: class I SAM-dependent methyltransferase [bacterium]|nr:class I SAM-dependent methyltransferase [bacterium]